MNIRSAGEMTPLIYCLVGAKENHQDRSYEYIKCVKLLIKAGADVYAMNEYECTALTFAVESGFTEGIDVLMKEGNIDVNMLYDDGTTMLMYAARNGEMRLIDFLLQNGADVNSSSTSGYTALIWAAEQGHNEGGEKLIAAGADVNKATNRGATALAATMNICIDRLRQYHYQLKGVNPDTKITLKISRGALEWFSRKQKESEIVFHCYAEQEQILIEYHLCILVIY